MDSHQPCLNCGHPLSGAYCSQCGQDAHHAPTLGHFFHDLTHEILHVDGKIFRSLRALFIQPGRLTAEYWAGRIVSWVRPLRLFLIVAALHLLLVHDSVGPLNFRVSVALNAAGQRDVVISPDLRPQLKPGFTPLDEKAQREFLGAFRQAYTGIRYLSVVCFAFASWLLYRSRQRHFVNHLVLGLHYYSFWYALAIVGSASPVISRVTVAISLAYLPLMLRRVYQQQWGWTLLKGFALIVVLVVIEFLLGTEAALMVERGWVH